MLVFVYGTLKEGYHNHNYFLSHCEKVADGHTSEAKYDLYCNGGFPYAVEGGVSSIKGQVFDVDEKTLEALDRLEGHPNFYERQMVPIKTGNDYVAAWMYIHPNTEKIRDNRYVEPVDNVSNWIRP